MRCTVCDLSSESSIHLEPEGVCKVSMQPTGPVPRHSAPWGVDREVSRRQLLAGGVGLAVGASGLVSMLTACTGTPQDSPSMSATTGASGGGGILSVATNQAPNSLIPGRASDNGSIWVTCLIFDRLITFTPGSDLPQPSLASSWKQSDDGLSYTFKIRKATFSNGDPVTVEDVKYSLDRFRDPETDPDYSFAAASYKAVTIVDEETIRIDLQRVDATALYGVGYVAAGIVPMKLLKQMGEDAFGKNPVGAGPFRVEDFKPGQALSLGQNEHYWRDGVPTVGSVEFTYAPNDTTRMLSVQSGQNQIGLAVPYAQATQVDGSDGTNVQRDDLLSIWSVWLNHTFGPLADRSVRQALNYATPKEEIIQNTLRGFGQVANSNAPNVQFTDPAIAPYSYDVAKAKELLAAAGGFELPLSIPGGDEICLQTAQILQAAWAEIGVTVKISQFDSGTLWSKWYAGTAPAFLTPTAGWTLDLPIPDGFAMAVYDFWDGGTSSYYTNYQSREAAALARELNGSVDSVVRQEKWRALQQLTLDDAVNVPIAFVPSVTALRDNVEGFHALNIGGWHMEDVSLT